MITKVTVGLTPIAKQPIRAKLQKSSVLGLTVLAGSSMSNMNSAHFEPTDMIIPDGLSYNEKAYFLLKGKLPKSVYERWIPHTDDYILQQNDQIVKVNIADGRYIGDIVEPPHKIDDILSNDDYASCEPILDNDGSDTIFGDTNETDIVNDDNSDFSILGIFKQFMNIQ